MCSWTLPLPIRIRIRISSPSPFTHTHPPSLYAYASPPHPVPLHASPPHLAVQVPAVLLEEYSIGYASLADAKAWKAQAASISNSDGEFVQPTARAVQEAMDATVQNKLSPTEAAALVGNASSSTTKLHYLSIVDPQGAKLAYPIAGLTYVGFDAARLDCTTLYSVVFLVWWALTDCQVCQALLARLAGRPFICSTCIGTAELNYKRMS